MDQATVLPIRELDGTEAISARFQGHRFAPHFHETYVVGLMNEGAERFWARGAWHVARPGVLRVYNPGEIHGGEAAPGADRWHYQALYPDVPLMRRLAAETGLPGEAPEFPDLIIDDPELAATFRSAFEIVCRSGAALERHSRFLLALSGLIERHASRRPSSSDTPDEPFAIGRVRRYLESQPARPTDLDELAGVAGLSPFHLLRAFRRQVGLTPAAYQAKLRVDLARRLLRRGLEPREVAAAAGFCDQSHLNRVFRRYTGLTPGKYRQAFLA